MIEDKNQITNKELNKIFWRMQLLNVTNNYESMQAIGFLSSFAPVIEKLYKNKSKEERVNAMKRHLEFYNSHVNSNALILGITAAIEETTDESQKDAVRSIKTGLMGPLAGIGDSVLKFTWLPICGSIGATLALNGSILGPLVMFLLYNIVNISTKYYGIHLGYKKGIALIEGSGGNILQRLSNIANIVGLIAIGSLIASVVKVKTLIEMTAGENTIKFQEMLDNVMPRLFSLLITFIVYKILKKTNGKHAPLIIVSIMIISIIFAYLKILG